MRHLVMAVAALVAVGTGCGSASQQDAAAAAERWALAHAHGWVLEADEYDSQRGFRFASFSHACPGTNGANLTTIGYAETGYDVELGFDCLSARPTDQQALRDSFSYVALDALPHGIALEGWKFMILTPTSSFSEGVELTVPADGRLSVRMTTPLYALAGYNVADPACMVADGSPPGCSVNRELGIPLTLTLTAPFSLQLFAN